jgi:hypothetical protein
MRWRYTHILNLVLIHRRYLVDDDPRQTAAEIHHLMHREAHESRGEDVVAHERVPCRPQPFKDIEL